MNTHISFKIVWISVLFFLTYPAHAPAAVLPQEPDEQHLMNEDINIVTGLYVREYSLSGDGIIDYKTARQIIISEYNEYWNSVVETNEYPLFYWHDPDHDGHFAMWVDQGGNGCLCDIIPYNIQTADSNPLSP